MIRSNFRLPFDSTDEIDPIGAFRVFDREGQGAIVISRTIDIVIADDYARTRVKYDLSHAVDGLVPTRDRHTILSAVR